MPRVGFGLSVLTTKKFKYLNDNWTRWGIAGVGGHTRIFPDREIAGLGGREGTKEVKHFRYSFRSFRIQPISFSLLNTYLLIKTLLWLPIICIHLLYRFHYDGYLCVTYAQILEMCRECHIGCWNQAVLHLTNWMTLNCNNLVSTDGQRSAPKQKLTSIRANTKAEKKKSKAHCTYL